ncbi:EAL domain-containing protein [Enterobacter quasiroggenkampii]|uniref:EAL domain-containing protein n=1 Tax=Enterobacter quasiroggenkampii TaxID=2497436 RepID=UPI001F263CB2|nr:EAL domain-containing protein [Enterobacter quasiroggenkampii]
MPYRLPFENAVRGIRFQPIYSVAEKVIKAWEILSLLQTGINPEQYFASQTEQSCLNILCWQLQIIYKMKNRKRYYLNVPARLLCSSQVIEQLVPWLREGIVLEVQDPHGFISLSRVERQAFYAHTRMIKSMGAELWLDDILPEQFSDLANELALFDGVKIDKSVVLLEPSSLTPLIVECARYVQFVLVEGVENSHHYEIAEESGSHFLQGFMWPEEQFYISYTAV